MHRHLEDKYIAHFSHCDIETIPRVFLYVESSADNCLLDMNCSSRAMPVLIALTYGIDLLCMKECIRQYDNYHRLLCSIRYAIYFCKDH